MNRCIRYLVPILASVAALAVILTGNAEAQTPNRRSTQFSDPARPGIVRIDLFTADVTVKTHRSNDVIIESDAVGGFSTSDAPADNEKAQGMKRLVSRGGSIDIKESNNTIEIRSPMPRDEFSVVITVPQNAEVFVNTSKEVTVSGVGGSLEVTSLEGDITLTGVTGPVVASTTDGDITAVFTSSPAAKPMYFSTVDGDVDVTFPAAYKATAFLKNVEGEIFTDFDFTPLSAERSPEPVKRQSRNGLTVYSTPYGKSTGTASTLRFTFPDSTMAKNLSQNQTASRDARVYNQKEALIAQKERGLAEKEEGLAEKEQALAEQLKHEELIKENIGLNELNFITNLPITFSQEIFGSMFGSMIGSSTISGTINGGGPDIQLMTIDGDIYLRKAK